MKFRSRSTGVVSISMRPFMTLVFAMILSGLVGSVVVAEEAQVKELLGSRFPTSSEGWQPTGEAMLSDVSRVPGGHSLLIKQWRDDQQGSQWLSPPIPNPGKPITISFWAADNYLRCGDFSYSACMDVVESDKEKKLLGSSEFLVQVVWDESRRSEMWGQLLPQGLLWKFYKVTYQPKGENFQLKFHWPKPLMRGDCYVTDIRVVAGESTVAAAPAAKSPEAQKTLPLNMEITTPVNGNLFLAGTPLRFEVLVYGDKPEAVASLGDATLHWQVSSFENRVLAQGTSSMKEAAPLADPNFVKNGVGMARKHHLHLPIVVTEPAARVVGQLLLIEVTLTQGQTELARQLASFGNVRPRPMDSQDQSLRHFSTQWFCSHYTLSDPAYADKSIAQKTGVSQDQVYDYSWKQVQPKYPGPMTFGNPLPAFPRITFCPNIEQSRVYETEIRSMVPPECVIADPLHPTRYTFEIDPYVEYIVAYIKHNRAAIARVVPSGLERSIDARTIELQRKAYAAIKAQWPDLPVGMMIYGLAMNPSEDANLFLKEKLYEVADFIDTHCYASSVDWSEWKRLQTQVKQLGKKTIPLMSTEFARVGGTDQLERARSMITSHLDAWANGMDDLYYFNQANESKYMSVPFGRGRTEVPGEQTGGFIYYQKMTWPVVSPLIVPGVPSQRWMPGAWGHVYGGSSLMPVLSTMTYYNLVQNYEGAIYRQMLSIDGKAVAYVFDRPDATVASVWTVGSNASATCRIRVDGPVVVQDLLGREQTLTPINGMVLLTIDEHPQTLILSKVKAAISFDWVDGGLTMIQGLRGEASSTKLTLPEDFKQDNLTVHCRVDDGWLDSRQAAKNGSKLRIEIPADARFGKHDLYASVFAGDKVVGLLKTEVDVALPLSVSIAGEPMTSSRNPAICITVQSRAAKLSRGVIRMTDEWFAPGLVPTIHELPYQVAPGRRTEISLPLSRALVKMALAYPVTVELLDDSGLVVSKKETIHFRASVRSDKPIVIDGDLSDWNLSELVGVPFERDFATWGKPRSGLDDCDGVIYSRWDEKNLYFAVVVRDQSPVHRFNSVDMWQDDNIMFGLYPWGLSDGQPMRNGFYREHLGLCADGKCRIFRLGSPQGGHQTSEGCPIAVRYTDGVFTYEWAYPIQAIYPMELKTGSAFRASFFVFDRDMPEPPVGTRWTLGGIQLGGFNTNINGEPDKWREFQLIDLHSAKSPVGP